MYTSHRGLGLLSLAIGFCFAGVAAAQQTEAPQSPPAGSVTPAPAELVNADAGVAAPEAQTNPDAAVPPEGPPSAEEAPPAEPPRGDTPVSLEQIVNPDAVPPPVAPPEVADAGVAPPPAAPEKEKPAKGPKGKEPKEPVIPPAPEQPAPPPVGPLVLWTTAGWANSFGAAHCGPQGLEGTDVAIKIASTLKHSSTVAGLGVAAAGALGDHPLIAWAAKEQPAALADLIAAAGFTAIAVGVADVSGALFREPGLSYELKQRGVAILASNIDCGGQAWCEPWLTADESLPIFERNGRRYAFISLLPDDLLGRVQPASGRRFELRSAADTLVALTVQAREGGAELIVASIDHGPDASVNVANFVAPMPPDVRPDLLISPSAGENLLFLRPLDVHPAIVGARAGVLMGLRVTKLLDSRDSDVFARSVQLNERDADLATRVQQLGAGFCEARGKALAGGHLATPLTAADLVQLGGDAVRQIAGADLAVVDPLVYDGSFSQPAGADLQIGQMERAVLLDSPLVAANVTLDWLGNLNKVLAGPRPLALIGTSTDHGDALIAGRIPVVGARYRIVTTAVLARSKRLPDGANWSLIDEPGATLRRALASHLDVASTVDPRNTVRDPAQSTQWVLRADGQIQANLTEIDNPNSVYDEPALQVNDSQQLGALLLLNLDADSPKFLFENALQIAFDRNFTTNTTAQDLLFLQSTYTYRGLWPQPLLYPHPFVEGYLETEFEQGDAAYHHLLVRPEAGLRSIFSRVLSFKLSAGFQYEVFQPDSKIYPGIGAELLLKPWTVALSNGTVQLEGNLLYYWNAPTELDQHTFRGQLITAVNIIGPLQFTLTALGAIRKDKGGPLAKGIGLQAGIRLRFVDRSISD